MFTLVRAVTYGSVFVGLLLVLAPARVLTWAGVVRPREIGVLETLGAASVIIGGAIALWCMLAFVFLGRGTPAPFDPPRRLVVAGPYRYVRNPMYLGAMLALGGAATFYRSFALLGYTGLLAAAMHAFVIWYEEPTLTRRFGDDYVAYRGAVGRWLPFFRSRASTRG